MKKNKIFIASIILGLGILGLGGAAFTAASQVSTSQGDVVIQKGAGKAIKVDRPVSKTLAKTSVAKTKKTLAKTNTTVKNQTIQIGSTILAYKNGGVSQGQQIIDKNPTTVVSTWGGASTQSNTDGKNTHFIGHNPGAFHVLFSVKKGQAIKVTDSTGNTTSYKVKTIVRVNDYAVNTVTGENMWDTITKAGNSERITLQTCVSDTINLIVIADK